MISYLLFVFQSIFYCDLKPNIIGMNTTNSNDSSDFHVKNMKLFDFGLVTELKEVEKIGQDAYNVMQ